MVPTRKRWPVFVIQNKRHGELSTKQLENISLSSQITFLTFLLNKNQSIDEKFKLRYNFNNTL